MLIPCSAAFAFSYDFSYELLSQVRENRAGQREVPINNYIGLELGDMPKEFSFTTNARILADPTRNSEHFAFDLYQAALHVEPVKEVLQLDGGRLWFVDGFSVETMDSVVVSVLPKDWHVGLTFYGGLPRSVEIGDFNPPVQSLIAGTRLSLQDVEDTYVELSAKYKKVNMRQTNYRQNDSIHVGISGMHEFSKVKSTPSIYGNVEYNIAGKVLEVGTLGFDIYPHWRLALNFEGNYFNTDRQSDENSLFETFDSGDIIEGRQSIELKLTKGFRFFEEFAYQRFSVTGRGSENGYLAEAGLGNYWKKGKFSTALSYYFQKNYGGTVNGAFLELINTYFKGWTAKASFDYSRYSKLLNRNGTAYSVVAGASYEFTDFATLYLGGEYNRNVWYNNDIRGTLDFTLHFDS